MMSDEDRLQPFRKIVEWYGDEEDDDHRIFCDLDIPEIGALTLGDLRRLLTIPRPEAGAAVAVVEADIEELLADLEEYFDDRADAEYFPDNPIPHPNEEMRFLVRVRDAQAALPASPVDGDDAPDLEKAATHLLDIIDAQGRAFSTAPKRETRDDEASRMERDEVFGNAVEMLRGSLKRGASPVDGEVERLQAIEQAARGLFAGGFIEAGARVPSTRPPQAEDQWAIELGERLKPLKVALDRKDAGQ